MPFGVSYVTSLFKNRNVNDKQNPQGGSEEPSFQPGAVGLVGHVHVNDEQRDADRREVGDPLGGGSGATAARDRTWERDGVFSGGVGGGAEREEVPRLPQRLEAQ